MFPNLAGSFGEISSDSSSVIDDFLASIRNQNTSLTSKQPKTLESKVNLQHQTENENFINFSTSTLQDDQISSENKLDIDVHYNGIFSDRINKKKKYNKQSIFSDEDDDDFNLKNPKDILQSKNSNEIHFRFKKTKPIIITSEELRQASLYNTNKPQVSNPNVKKSKRKKSPNARSKADPNHSLYNSKNTEKSKNKSSQTQTKTIKKPKKEINEMVERLSKPAPRPKAEKQTSTKRLTSNEIFDRLYDMSTEKQKKIEEIRQNEIQKEIEEELINQNSVKCTQKSIELAERKVLRFVEHCFKHLSQNVENKLFSSLYIESTQTKDQAQQTNVNQTKDIKQFQNETELTRNETESIENETNLNVKNEPKSNMENDIKQTITESNDTAKTNENEQINITNKTGINETKSIDDNTKQNQTELTQIKIVPINDKKTNENEMSNTNNSETFAISKNCVIKREISQNELFEILFKLGLITSRNEKIDQLLQNKINEWILNEDKSTYDCKSIYKDIIYSVKGNSSNLSQFNKFCKKRILISLSNLKNFQNEQSAINKSIQNNFMTNQKQFANQNSINQNETINYNPINVNRENEHENNISRSSNKKKKSVNTPIPSDSILRLSQCRRRKEINHSKTEDPFPIRKRDVFKMNPYSEELEKPKQSKQTKLIYQQEIAKISFHDRETILLEKRKLRMKQIEEENYNVKVKTFHRDPNFTHEIQQQLKEYKEKKEKMPCKVENTFKPTIIDYDEFKKTILKEMIEKKERPGGYYSDISRHRMAYHKYLEEKKEKEKEEDLDYIYSKF